MGIIDKEPILQLLDICLAESDGFSPIVDATLTAIKCYIEDAPTVDAEFVRHGHWESPVFYDALDVYDPRCECSVCGSIETPLARHRYCPNCGAKMRGERKENEDIKNKEAN